MISDRFVDSTRAYQGLDVGRSKIDALYTDIAGDFKPDLTLLLDVPVDVGMARVASRHGPDDRYEQRPKLFHENLRTAYMDLAVQEPARFRVIDASGEVELVAKAICDSVATRFALAPA